ncbi:TSUP family transporter [Rouxiella sp. S1S-2]|uniref:sulfite exporter TauE/SafE family protein n=1 Tax=Rouxiella sp. S1S-2 TaxID=2653856 RepID=UPI001265A04A|nr:sulfite exporter TauE/SafE family protein [Rouxiella sp. S1S-2]KAB7898924.1 TSUP family transporter [Rouxiella sp. S1S-2]
MYLVIILIGVLAGTLSGVVGTGSSIMLLPALTYTFGPKAAIPIMAIAAIMGNVSRVILWRKEINYKAFMLYAIPGIPAAVLGANTLWVMPVELSNLCIGLFFLLLIPLRRWAKAQAFTLTSVQLALVGAVVGYLTGVVFSTGPITIPIFAGYGLVKGALLSTEAAASFAIYLAKASTFEAIGALPASVFICGILVGSTLIMGTLIGKRFVLRLSENVFNRLIDAMLLIAGVSLLWDAVV